MFKFQETDMYQMPVHFGPCCGPRRGPDGERFYKKGPQESTQHTLVYETEAELLEHLIPEGFTVRCPYVIVTHKMHRNLPWLAGRGYNVVSFNTPVFYRGQEELVCGQYQLAIWENHADPIISGREQLGYSKVFAEIENMDTCKNTRSASLSSWGFRFLELRFDTAAPPEDRALLEHLILDEQSEGLLHYKYFPHTGDGFNRADVAQVVISPKKCSLPGDIPPLPPVERSWCGADLSWRIPTWEDMPTQYHIVRGLAGLPVKRILGGSAARMKHYNDVYDQREVR